MQQIAWGQCNGGCSRYHGNSAMEDVVDITETVQWGMQWISWRQCNGGCSVYHEMGWNHWRWRLNMEKVWRQNSSQPWVSFNGILEEQTLLFVDIFLILRKLFLLTLILPVCTGFSQPYTNEIKSLYSLIWASPVAQMVKSPPAMQETQVQSLGQEDPLEKVIVTHASVLAWRIPWIEEPGGLQSMGSQRVRHDWATEALSKKPSNCGRSLAGQTKLPAIIPLSTLHLMVVPWLNETFYDLIGADHA